MTDKIIIDTALARYLIDKQFPQWIHLSIEPVKKSGWDNRTLGVITGVGQMRIRPS